MRVGCISTTIRLGGALGVSLLLGCACALAASQRDAGEPWTLTLAVSGGFIGADRQLTLTNDGKAEADDRRSGQVRAGTVPSAQLAEIRRLVAGVQASESRDARCRDCFEYVLTLERRGARTIVRVNDAALSQDANGPAVIRLNQLLMRLLSGEAL